MDAICQSMNLNAFPFSQLATITWKGLFKCYKCIASNLLFKAINSSIFQIRRINWKLANYYVTHMSRIFLQAKYSIRPTVESCVHGPAVTNFKQLPIKSIMHFVIGI